VNIMEFVKQFNAKTAQAQGMTTPVVVTIFKDGRSASSPRRPRRRAPQEGSRIEKGSPTSNRQKVGKVTRAQLKKIAELRCPISTRTTSTPP